jgi:hypothetical protein
MRRELIDGIEVVDGATRRVGFASFGVGGRFLDLDTGVVGQPPRRFGKAEPLHLHQEVERRALFLTTKTIEKTLLGIHVEARRFFAMKRTEADEAPSLSRKLHRFGDDGHDFDAIADRRDGLGRNHCHP